MKTKEEIVQQINNLKDWLYIHDGAYGNRSEWRTILIESLNLIIKEVSELKDTK